MSPDDGIYTFGLTRRGRTKGQGVEFTQCHSGGGERPPPLLGSVFLRNFAGRAEGKLKIVFARYCPVAAMYHVPLGFAQDGFTTSPPATVGRADYIRHTWYGIIEVHH